MTHVEVQTIECDVVHDHGVLFLREACITWSHRAQSTEHRDDADADEYQAFWCDAKYV